MVVLVLYCVVWRQVTYHHHRGYAVVRLSPVIEAEKNYCIPPLPTIKKIPTNFDGLCLDKKQLGSTSPWIVSRLVWSIYIPVWPKYLHSSSLSKQKFSCRSLEFSNNRRKFRITRKTEGQYRTKCLTHLSLTAQFLAHSHTRCCHQTAYRPWKETTTLMAMNLLEESFLPGSGPRGGLVSLFIACIQCCISTLWLLYYSKEKEGPSVYTRGEWMGCEGSFTYYFLSIV